MEYLTVKDVAVLVRRNEETIRRMIRARKLDVTLDNNNRRQGYLISVDQLTRTWDISREEVQSYIDRQRAQQRQQPPEKLPLGQERATADDGRAPESGERDFGAETGDVIAKVLERSAHLIAREINRAAQAGKNAGAESGEGSDMSGDYNNWVNTDGRRNESGNDVQQEQTRKEPDFSADFAAAGERVSEIIGDAYRQIRRAVDQAGAAYAAARDQAAAEVNRAREEAGFASSHSAAERARRAREQGQTAIRDTIARGRAQSAPSSDGVHATGGWAESIKPMGEVRHEDLAGESCAREAHCDEPSAATATEAPACGEAARREWEDAEPTPAPEFERFRGRQIDLTAVGEPKIDAGGFETAECNASYQLLQAARRAVEERIRAGRQTELQERIASEEPAKETAEAAPAACECESAAADETALEPQPAAAEAECVQPSGAAAEPEREQEPAQSDAPQLPTHDEDAMQKRIDSLEAQLRKMSGQLEQLTRKLLGDDK